ncbi:hypothetical protein D3C75_478460 [compost metagenome]
MPKRSAKYIQEKAGRMCAYADSYGDGWFDQHLDAGNWRTWNGLTPMKEARRFYLVGGTSGRVQLMVMHRPIARKSCSQGLRVKSWG